MAVSNTLKILQTKPNFSKTKNIRRKLIIVPKSHDQDLSSKQHLFWGWSIPLTWSDHVDLITKKVNKGLNILRRLREFMDINVLITDYKTLVQPYFDYCSQVWGYLGTTLSNKLQRMQNRAARIITKCGHEYRSTVLLSYLNLSNLQTRRNHQLSILMLKLSQGLIPNYLTDLFTRTDQIHNYETRHAKSNYRFPKPNSNAMKQSFICRGAVVWNKLPSEIQNSISIGQFKNYIRP